ncbi:MAG TPA: hypothetical protein VEY50_00115 [Lysobacter sp.]|nr:hypothetical protein [Lysobacter sp.]
MLHRLALATALSLLCLSAVAVPARAQEAPKIADNAQNPPPKAPLNRYQRFELAPVAMGAPYTEHETNRVALERLQANIDLRAKPVVDEWNAKAAAGGRTLKIQPEIRYIRFITGGKRFWGGAFAGDSAILLKVRMADAASGEVIAEPEFYQRANAMGAAWSFGATDKHMLIRMSAMLEHYLRSNYTAAVGGPVAVAPGHEEAAEDDGKNK